MRVSDPEHSGLRTWDFVQGSIRIGDSVEGQPGGNFISKGEDVTQFILPLADQQKMCDICDKYKSQMGTFTGDIPGVSVDDTIAAINHLLAQYPNPITPEGRVLTNCDADPAKHLSQRPGVPREVRERAHRQSVEWRIRGFRHLLQQLEAKSWPDDYAFYRSAMVLGKALTNTLLITEVKELMTPEIIREIENNIYKSE